MSAKKQRPRKHIPQRTCVGCRETLSKRSLIRIVRRTDGVFVDPTGKMAGRGAYLHDKKSCWESALQNNRLGRALRVQLTENDLERLKNYMLTLPDQDEMAAETD